MKYSEAIDYINQRYKKGSVYGLEPVTALFNRLGNPQREQKIIHIAGTNGKGSVGTFISYVLVEQGYKVGRFISPSVYCYEERFQINNKYISKADFAEVMTEVADAEKHIDYEPTGFELECGVALQWFKREKCDFSIIECGLGGANDATNVIDNNLICLLTAIGLDHTAILGDTVEKIAAEKCGIIKRDTNVISADQADSVKNIIEQSCKRMNATCTFVYNDKIKNNRIDLPYQMFDYAEFKNIKISMLGSYQYENAALALCCIKKLNELGYDISSDSIYNGMKKASWGCRFQLVNEKPLFILDGAHNPQGAKKLVESLKLYFGDKKIIYITGMFKDKDYRTVMEITAPLAYEILTVTPPTDRGLEAEILAETAELYNKNVKATDIKHAFEYCMKQKDSVIVAFGSLSFMGILTEHITDYKE